MPDQTSRGYRALCWALLCGVWVGWGLWPASAAETKGTAGEWKSLFNGKDLGNWGITDFAGKGDVTVDPNFKGGPAIVVEQGLALTGIHWTSNVPKVNYEIELESMKLMGHDFMCALTFPVKESACSFVLGGWGGAVVGISSIDGADASENETTKFMQFENDRWYRVRVRVTPNKIEGWVDSEKLVDLPLEERRISVRSGEIELSQPLGLAAYQTRAAWRGIRIRELEEPKDTNQQ